jgi:hypothetical protein
MDGTGLTEVSEVPASANSMELSRGHPSVAESQEDPYGPVLTPAVIEHQSSPSVSSLETILEVLSTAKDLSDLMFLSWPLHSKLHSLLGEWLAGKSDTSPDVRAHIPTILKFLVYSIPFPAVDAQTPLNIVLAKLVSSLPMPVQLIAPRLPLICSDHILQTKAVFSFRPSLDQESPGEDFGIRISPSPLWMKGGFAFAIHLVWADTHNSTPTNEKLQNSTEETHHQDELQVLFDVSVEGRKF